MSTEVTRRPFTDFASMRDRLDRFFDDVVGLGRDDDSWSLALDVQRTDEGLKLRADVPGIQPDEIKISVEDGVLTVSGEHEQESEKEDEGYIRRERRYGSFRRTLALPPEAEPEKIAATVKDGVVEITVPVGELPSAQKIEITPTAG